MPESYHTPFPNFVASLVVEERFQYHGAQFLTLLGSKAHSVQPINITLSAGDPRVLRVWWLPVELSEGVCFLRFEANLGRFQGLKRLCPGAYCAGNKLCTLPRLWRLRLRVSDTACLHGVTDNVPGS